MGHALQPATFLGSVLWFWRAVLFGERRAAGYGLAVLYLFFTALHSGALIAFASGLWHPSYATTTNRSGLTPLEDQQLGGMSMWVPAGLICVGAGLALFAAWLRESERRVASRAQCGRKQEEPTCVPHLSS